MSGRQMPPAQAWIACRARTRPVVGGVVACPVRGPVPAEVCLGCRHLMTRWDERRAGAWCVADEPTTPAELGMPAR